MYRICRLVLYLYEISSNRNRGKQYKVAVGDKLNIGKLDNEVGSDVVFDKVLLVLRRALKLALLFKGVKVEAKLLDTYKDKKRLF